MYLCIQHKKALRDRFINSYKKRKFSTTIFSGTLLATGASPGVLEAVARTWSWISPGGVPRDFPVEPCLVRAVVTAILSVILNFSINYHVQIKYISQKHEHINKSISQFKGLSSMNSLYL